MGGTGFDVLDGRARVFSSSGEDWTEQLVAAGTTMLDHARRQSVRLALLMDISAACGSQVIYRGARSQGVHQPGQGVCAALLIRAGIPVVSQRDRRTLALVLAKVDGLAEPDTASRDHHESEWYAEHLGS